MPTAAASDALSTSAAVPALASDCTVMALNGRGQPKSADDLAICPAIEHLRLAAAIHREALAATLQHAEIVVVGVVLHHQHHDVPDLRKEIGSGRQGEPGTRAPPGG